VVSSAAQANGGEWKRANQEKERRRIMTVKISFLDITSHIERPPSAHHSIQPHKASIHSIYSKFALIAASSALGFAPTTSAIFSPFLNSKNVGMARMPSSCATSGTSSTSSL
jgi:hypothetical protein